MSFEGISNKYTSQNHLPNSGFDFFKSLLSKTNHTCISAEGASNIYECLQKMKGYEEITVIADGAAFGSQMEKVFGYINQNQGIQLYLPESFEWIILSSGVLKNNEIMTILEDPAEYIEGQDYFSWERFFTHLLIENSKDTYLKYTKTKLNPAYLKGKVCESIITVLPKSFQQKFNDRK